MGLENLVNCFSKQQNKYESVLFFRFFWQILPLPTKRKGSPVIATNPIKV
jgi:hypothetical protein